MTLASRRRRENSTEPLPRFLQKPFAKPTRSKSGSEHKWHILVFAKINVLRLIPGQHPPIPKAQSGAVESRTNRGTGFGDESSGQGTMMRRTVNVSAPSLRMNMSLSNQDDDRNELLYKLIMATNNRPSEVEELRFLVRVLMKSGVTVVSNL